jgi:hypothetical protein
MLARYSRLADDCAARVWWRHRGCSVSLRSLQQRGSEAHMTAATYEGKPCRKDGSTTRYRSNRKCVKCYTLPVKFFELKPDGTARELGITEVAYCRQPGRTYWRATPIDIK